RGAHPRAHAVAQPARSRRRTRRRTRAVHLFRFPAASRFATRSGERARRRHAFRLQPRRQRIQGLLRFAFHRPGMTSRHQTLTLFLTSLVISLGWYAYDSRDFTLMLDRLLIGAAAGYAIAWAVNSRQHTSAADDARNRARGLAPLRAWTWWNTLLFFVLVYASSIVATVRYQHTRGEYALELGGHALALVVIGAAAWRLTGKRPLLALHLPLACGSL